MCVVLQQDLSNIITIVIDLDLIFAHASICYFNPVCVHLYINYTLFILYIFNLLGS